MVYFFVSMHFAVHFRAFQKISHKNGLVVKTRQTAKMAITKSIALSRPTGPGVLVFKY